MSLPAKTPSLTTFHTRLTHLVATLTPKPSAATRAMAAGTQSTTHINGTAGGAAQPKIHLYTNHRCPFAHRAHIVLEELGLPFEETIIDLDTPRPQW